MGYWLVRNVVKLLMFLIARVEIQGKENLPKSGAFVATANHIGRIDAFLTYDIFDRPDVILIIAEKYRKVCYWRWMVRLVNGIWIDRYNADFGALREVLRRLKAGGVLAIAPEGTRSPDGTLQEARQGAAFLAVKSGLLVVPVGVVGCEDLVAKDQFKRFRKLDIKVRVGEPYHLPALSGRDRDAQLEKATDEIMCHIAALLPEDRRGVYSNHPRLEQLLAGSPVL